MFLLKELGKLLTTTLPPESTNLGTKFAKDTHLRIRNPDMRAKKFIEAKLEKSKAVLDFLSQRYPEIKFDV